MEPKGINRNLGGFSNNKLRNVTSNDLIAVELFESSYRKPLAWWNCLLCLLQRSKIPCYKDLGFLLSSWELLLDQGDLEIFISTSYSMSTSKPRSHLVSLCFASLHSLIPYLKNIKQITIYSHPGWTSPSMVSLHKTSPPREQFHSSMHHWLMWTSDMQWLLVMSIG